MSVHPVLLTIALANSDKRICLSDLSQNAGRVALLFMRLPRKNCGDSRVSYVKIADKN